MADKITYIVRKGGSRTVEPDAAKKDKPKQKPTAEVKKDVS